MKLKVVTQDVCPSCSVLKNYLDNEHEDTEVEYINISQHPELIEELGVNSTPTTLLWDDEFGEPVSKFVGFVAGRDEEHIDDIVGFVE